MTEWKRVRLGDVAELIPGFAFKSSCFGDQHRSKVIKITNIAENGIYASELSGVDISGLNKSRLDKYRVGVGDYVVAMTGSIGKIGKVVDGEAYINQRVLTIRPKDDVDKVFLFCVVRTKAFLQHMVTHIDSHSVQANISAGSIGEYEFFIPPLVTQKKIAAVLGAIDDKIETNRKICANLEAQAQALFKSWFVDFEPFGGKMPKDWKMAPIEEFAVQIASGGTPKTKNELFYNGDIRWFSTKELQDGFLFDSEKHISKEAVDNSAAKLFPRNTILMAIYAAPTVGRLGILDLESTFNQAAVGIIAKEEVGFPYMFMLLKNEREALNLMAVGSCQQNLNVGTVRSYKALLPDAATLERFNDTVIGLFEQMRVLARESRALASMRDALLPRLMSGEIDVEKVEVA